MKQIFLSLLILQFAFTSPAQNKKLTLPNGWSLTPAGRSFALGDLPLNMAISSSKKYMAVTNNGQSKQYLQLIDVKNERVLDSITIPKSWVGIKFSADEKYLYASGGNDNWILQYSIVKTNLNLLAYLFPKFDFSSVPKDCNLLLIR